MDRRIERTHKAVREATIMVLGARGYAAFTMEAVAETAGVSKSTIYRHWPTKLALIADALETLNQQPKPEITGTSVRERVRQLLRHLAEVFADSPLAACIPALIGAAEHHEEVAGFLHEYSTRRRMALVNTLREGMASGELSPNLDAELAALALSGAIIYRRTMTPDPLDPEKAAELVDLVLGRKGV